MVMKSEYRPLYISLHTKTLMVYDSCKNPNPAALLVLYYYNIFLLWYNVVKHCIEVRIIWIYNYLQLWLLYGRRPVPNHKFWGKLILVGMQNKTLTKKIKVYLNIFLKKKIKFIINYNNGLQPFWTRDPLF